MADDVVNPSSLCHCSDHKAVHVHCFCGVCNGKAVNYRTQISHLRLSTSYSTERTEEQHKSELAASSGSDSDLHVIEGKLTSSDSAFCIKTGLKRSCK